MNAGDLTALLRWGWAQDRAGFLLTAATPFAALLAALILEAFAS